MKAQDRAAAIEVVQRCYPQIYLACHVRHIRAASTAHHLSANDSSLLVHLHPTEPMTPTALAAHMGIGAPALSAAIGRLARFGYLRREQNSQDRRAATLTLTPQGSKAMAATSVLDSERVADLLDRLTSSERRRALNGLELLAKASRNLTRDLHAKEKTNRRKRS
jgi:DNA-binding MarR family transcriptional regulator